MFLFGGNKKPEVAKIQGNFAQKAKTTLKGKLCSLCQKNVSEKVVFGEGIKPNLACKNCELKAVGGNLQKLGPKNLIESQKFSNLLTAELIAYQATQQDPPAQNRKNIELHVQLTKKVKQTSDQLKQQLRIMKQRTRQKLQELTIESEKQNTVLIFEEVSKSQTEKRPLNTDLLNNMVKRSYVSSSGVRFTDDKSIAASDASIKQRYDQLKSECKVKSKSLNNLIDEINNIKI